MKHKYQLYAYDTWGDETDGYYVNDVIRTDCLCTIDPTDTEQTIIKCLKEHSVIKKGLHFMSVLIDGDEDTLYITDIRKNVGFKPFCELRRVS